MKKTTVFSDHEQYCIEQMKRCMALAKRRQLNLYLPEEDGSWPSVVKTPSAFLQPSGFTTFSFPSGHVRVPTGHPCLLLPGLPGNRRMSLIVNSNMEIVLYLSEHKNDAYVFKRVIPKRASQRASKKLRDMIKTARGNYWKKVISERLALLFFGLLLDWKASGEAATDEDILVEKIKKLLDAHIFDTKLSVLSMARQLGCSHTHLGRLFQRRFGMRTIPYLTRERMKQAEWLLRTTDMDMLAVANGSGYKRLNYFGQIFRQHYGMQPSHYRAYLERRGKRA